MIRISKDIVLQPVEIQEYNTLSKLMHEIYPSAYAHMWHDSGQGYLQETYSKENLERELSDQYSSYFFVIYQGNAAGIFKFDTNTNYRGNKIRATKLHRIYLSKAVQGKGIGSQLLIWLEKEQYPEYEEIWLQVMDTEEKAIKFYQRHGYTAVGETKLVADNLKEQYAGMIIMSKKLYDG